MADRGHDLRCHAGRPTEGDGKRTPAVLAGIGNRCRFARTELLASLPSRAATSISRNRCQASTASGLTMPGLGVLLEDADLEPDAGEQGRR